MDYQKAYDYSRKELKTDSKLLDLQKQYPDLDWDVIFDRLADAYVSGQDDSEQTLFNENDVKELLKKQRHECALTYEDFTSEDDDYAHIFYAIDNCKQPEIKKEL